MPVLFFAIPVLLRSFMKELRVPANRNYEHVLHLVLAGQWWRPEQLKGWLARLAKLRQKLKDFQLVAKFRKGQNAPPGEISKHLRCD